MQLIVLAIGFEFMRAPWSGKELLQEKYWASQEEKLLGSFTFLSESADDAF
jgi:hypothetical protein